MIRAPQRRHRHGRHSRWALPAVLVVCLACLVPAYAAVAPSQPPGRRPTPHASPAPGPPVTARVTVAADAQMTDVPRSFFGVSTEYGALPAWAPAMGLLERALTLLHVDGNGPMVLRIGGDSADHAFWDPQSLPLPRWAFTLAPRWVRQARALVQALGVRLILDLNLITDTPATAAQWARAAEAGLPRGSISAFEVGNEPDIYSRADWVALTAGRPFTGRAFGGRRLPRSIAAAGYVAAFQDYTRALRRVAPEVKLAGPALANPVTHGRWVERLIRGAGHALGLVTIHRYPYSACARRSARAYPTVARLLSPAASGAMAQALVPQIDAAHDAGLALRVTELNSVTCGGLPGVSTSFATALWAPDALFSLLRAGADGVNLHVRANTINAPFALTAQGFLARPLMYGLILFTRALGPEARLVAVASSHPRAVQLSAWAVRVGTGTLHVVLIDKGRRAARVSLRLPGTGRAELQRLLAPSAAAQGDVTLAGRRLAADGNWVGPAATQTVTPRAGRYTVELHRQSALLLSVRVRPGALGATGVQPRRVAGRAPAASRSRRR